MTGEPRRRLPGVDAPHYGSFDGLFTVEIRHRGFFFGSDCNMTYMDYEVDRFDNCDSDTWSVLWIDDFLKQLGYDRSVDKHDVYWCQPGKSVADGLKEIKCDADILLMISATTKHKNSLLIIDHGDTWQTLTTDDVLLDGATELPRIITPSKVSKGKETAWSSENPNSPKQKREKRVRRSMYFGEGSSSGVGHVVEEMEGGESREAEGQEDNCDEETDEEFYDSDFDAEDGDDDLFDKIVDKEVDDHRESEFIPLLIHPTY
ncbi:uncharacterized protein [Triticum aestivum]|uniref:uncharacterized protein isoform X2 n=1 Tax=Triticum aestivum TaxID=4565 RepID=UPI0008432800|nr:uncharacterized protein LOC123129031 isoform X2 [Triticum aestivum]